MIHLWACSTTVVELERARYLATGQRVGEPIVPRVETLLQGSLLDSDQGGIAFCAVTLIEGVDSAGRTCRVVVDPGSSGRLGALTSALARRGLTGSDIDVVVLTHAHWDHMQNLDPFDRAVVLAHPAELDYIKNPHARDSATPRWTKAVLDCYDVRSVTDGHELMPGASIMSVPGHSAGTMAVAVSTDAGVGIVTGDAIQTAQVATSGRNALVFWDEQEANRSVRRIIDHADLIYPGHDRAFRLSNSRAVEYTQEFQLTITGVRADTPGFRLVDAAGFEPVILEPAR